MVDAGVRYAQAERAPWWVHEDAMVCWSAPKLYNPLKPFKVTEAATFATKTG
jgi:hypothetical protein